MIVRKAVLSDLPKLVEFNLNLAKETENKILDSVVLEKGILKIINGEIQGKYFVCEIDGYIAGQTMILYEWSDWRNGEFIWIQSVYVDSKYRGKGVFKELFNFIKNYCDSNNRFVGIRLYVEKENLKAKKVYSLLGMNENQYDMYEYKK